MSLLSKETPSPNACCAQEEQRWQHVRVLYGRAGKTFVLNGLLVTSASFAFDRARFDQTDLLRPFTISSLHLSVVLGFGSMLISAFLWMMSSRRTASATLVAHLRFTLLLASITFLLSLLGLAHAFFTDLGLLSGKEAKEQTSR